MAFGEEVKVGVISVANPDYDPAQWWRYSEGVRQVLSESVAYVYAKVFFIRSRSWGFSSWSFITCNFPTS